MDLHSPNITTTKKRLRLLVAIASFGEKNLGYLKSIIATYRSMSFAVDVVVLSNAPKELGPDVKVLVGLPVENPWSLPFAHKPVFAENADAYDLFIYSEDDMGVSEENIQAFLRVTPKLAPDEIAGYLRYEADPAGNWSLPEVHGVFHWKPESVRRRENLTIADFSNEHAAFYLLNQSQLKQSIASGGFLRAPYEGRHDMLCAAATDPYTSCGFRKVICISELESFCIHHLPNRYIGQFGLPLTDVKRQLQTLEAIGEGRHPISTLCEVESKLQRMKWSKGFYEVPSKELIEAIPANAKTILSVGCGWGAMEIKLHARGAAVTALPLDSVIGAEPAHGGIEVIYGTLEEGLGRLNGRNFDCVVIANLLPLMRDPESVLGRLVTLLKPEGVIVISGPNFGNIRVRARRIFNKEDCGKLRSFDESGIDIESRKNAIGTLKRLGWNRITSWWINSSGSGKTNLMQRFTARDWVIQVRR